MSVFKRSLQERHIFPENGEIAPSRRAWKPTAEQVDIGQYLLMFLFMSYSEIQGTVSLGHLKSGDRQIDTS